MNIQIERKPKGLEIKIIGFQTKDEIDWENEIIDALFWEDMYLDSYGSEWQYIKDANHNAVYMVDGYGFNRLGELKKNGETLIEKSPFTYEEYENENF